MKPSRVSHLNDRTLLMEFPGQPSAEMSTQLLAWCTSLSQMENVIDAWHGHTQILIETNDPNEVRQQVERLSSKVRAVAGGREIQIGCVYDGEDLEWMSAHLHLSLEEIVSAHATSVYDVLVLGSPGFIYLSRVPPEIAVPRLDRPRVKVPEGSVGIGGSQTGIYGKARPGGWRLIGRIDGAPPQLRPGDRVRFQPK